MSNKRRLLAMIALSLSLIAIGGCNGVAAPQGQLLQEAPAPQLEAGWTEATKENFGFKIALPPGWEWRDFAEMNQMLNVGPGATGRDIGRGLFSASAGYFTEDDGVGLMAFGGEEALVMLVLTKESQRKTLDLDTEGESLAREARSYPYRAGEVEAKKVDLPVGPAYRVIVEQGGAAFGNPDFKFIMKSYVLVDGKDRYKALFFETNNGNQEEVRTKRIMDTFRLVRPVSQ